TCYKIFKYKNYKVCI
ncbi:50S ribosomal L23 domain protein, partial [Chlamydia psittaci 02DC14]